MDSTPCNDETAAWCALLRAPGVGGQTLNPLLAAVGSARQLIEDPPENTPKALRDYLRKPDWHGVEADIRWLEQPHNRLLRISDPRYPARLRQLPNPPSALFLHGDPDLLSLPQLAIVGSRNPSTGGRRNAHDFAAHLAAAGLVISSGLALGIDAACHQGALDADAPTVAVMGTGLDRVYPARHRDLARRIAEQGALVSEFPIGTAPRAENFPRRNRIISGLSLGTLVVEAAIRSGSLITARYAGDQGREVFAIPGSIHNPLARGCHHLIRQGAKLVETAQDVIDELGMLANSCYPPDQTTVNAEAADEPLKLDPDYQQLIDFIGFDNTSIDQLVCRSGLTPAEVSSMLLQLEMSGYIASSHGGTYNRLK